MNKKTKKTGGKKGKIQAKKGTKPKAKKRAVRRAPAKAPKRRCVYCGKPIVSDEDVIVFGPDAHDPRVTLEAHSDCQAEEVYEHHPRPEEPSEMATDPDVGEPSNVGEGHPAAGGPVTLTMSVTFNDEASGRVAWLAALKKAGCSSAMLERADGPAKGRTLGEWSPRSFYDRSAAHREEMTAFVKKLSAEAPQGYSIEVEDNGRGWIVVFRGRPTRHSLSGFASSQARVLTHWQGYLPARELAQHSSP